MTRTGDERLQAKVDEHEAAAEVLRDIVVRGLTNWVPGTPVPAEVADAYPELLHAASRMLDAEEALSDRSKP